MKWEKEKKLTEEIKAELIVLKVDGFKNLVRSKFKLTKCTWLVVMFASLAAAVIFIRNSILEYTSYKVVSTTRFLSESSAVFPVVTVCNMNPFMSMYGFSLFWQAQVTNMANLEAWYRQKYGRYMTQEETALMDNLDSVMISCTFQGRACNASDFRYVPKFATSFQCYQFNSGRDAMGNEVALKTVSAVDAAGGEKEFNALKLELFAGVPIWTRYMARRGFFVYINNQNDYPYNTDHYNQEATGGTRIGVRRFYAKQYNAWPYKYSECTVNEDGSLIKPLDDRSLFDVVLSFSNYTYTRDTCYYICIQYLIAKSCNCTFIQVDFKIDNYETCYTDKQFSCLLTFQSSLSSSPALYENCKPRCPLECKRQGIDYYVSKYKYPPSKAYATNLRRNNPKLARYFSSYYDYWGDFENNIVEFSVFYDSLWYKESEEEPKMTLEALIAEIGAHLHVFLGMSLLSFVELVDLFAQLVLMAHDARKKKRVDHTRHLRHNSLPNTEDEQRDGDGNEILPNHEQLQTS